MRFLYLSLICSSTLLTTFSHADTQRALFHQQATQQFTYRPLAHASERTNLIQFAKTLIGTPYQYGGTTRSGFDCSGLVRFVFAHLGHDLPRVSRAQYQELSPVEQPQIGDLVFFGHAGHVNHVGIYVGEGKMLHAPSSGKTVTIDDYTSGYWGKRYLGARSAIKPPTQTIAASTTYYINNRY